MTPWTRHVLSRLSAKKVFGLGLLFDVAEVNQQPCLKESGQWLENVDRTHLGLASGKLVLQKSPKTIPRITSRTVTVQIVKE